MGTGGDEIDGTDPSSLTTQQLLREVDRLKELVDSRLVALNEIFTERFTAVHGRLDLVEQQRVEQKADTKAAVDAALTAQKEAVREQTIASDRAIEKSETATTKSIEGLGTTTHTAVEGLRTELGDLKTRMTTVEQRKVGGSEVTDRAAVTLGQVLAVVAAVAAIAAILVGAFT